MPVAIQNRMPTSCQSSVTFSMSCFEFKTSSHFESLAQSFQPIQLILLSLSLSGAVTSGNSNVLRHRERERERMKLVLCVVGTLPLKLSEVGGTEVCKFPLSVFCGLLVSRILLHCPSHLWVFRCLSFKQPVWCLSNRKLRGHACKCISCYIAFSHNAFSELAGA